MITVESKVPIYEWDGKSPQQIPPPSLLVLSHWNNDKEVVIQVEGGLRITVIASDLIAAIKNATNINRFG